MSTLRVSNIEAKADVSSPSVNEKVKVTNSNGELLIHIDGATSGITTVGISTSGESFRFDSNQNVTFFGSVTGTGLDVNGNADISGNLNVGGVLTYEDVTNIDSVGVVTARNGLQVTGGNVGIDQSNPTNKLEVEGSAAVARFVGNRTDALGPRLSLAKSRGSTSGSATIVQDGDEIGQIMFKGADGTDADSTGAAIIGLVDGTPGVNDMPGALTFLTTNDGTNSPTERLRLDSDGNMGLGGAAVVTSTAYNAAAFHLRQSGASKGAQLRMTTQSGSGHGASDGFVLSFWHNNDVYFENRENGNIRFQTNGGERLRITSDGKIGIGIANPTLTAHIYSTAAADAALIESTQNYATLRFKSALNSSGPTIGIDGAGGLQLDQKDTSKYISFAIGSERLRIASNGTTTVGPQYDQVKIEPGNGTYDGEATTLSVDGRTNDGNRVALKVDRYDSGTSATTKFSVKYDGTIFSTSGMQAASVNLQSSSTASWFQTGANYGGADYVWAAKNTQTNTWHSGLKTTGDLYLGGDITGTRNISLNGSNGSATFTGKINVGSSYAGGEIFALGKSSGTSYLAHYNGGTANGFIGHADQLVSGGSATDYAVRATSNLIFANGSSESVRIASTGYAYFFGYPTTHTVANGSPIKVRSGPGAWGISIGMRSPNNDYAYIGFTDANGTESLADIYSQRTGTNNGTLNFNTNDGTGNATRVRIGTQGELTNRGATYCIGARSVAGSSSVNTLYFGAHSSNSMTSGTVSYEVYTNGTVKNATGSYGNLSDERLKENIIDAPSQWDDIKSLRIRKYNFRDNNGYETHTQIGLVAQETESVCPGLVQTTPVREDATPVLDADGNALETTKSVSTSVLYMKAVKALQEAQTRIETLETQLTDALARITTLEGS